MLEYLVIWISIIYASFVEWALNPIEVVKLLGCPLPVGYADSLSYLESSRRMHRTENLIVDQRIAALFFVCHEMTAASVLERAFTLYF